MSDLKADVNDHTGIVMAQEGGRWISWTCPECHGEQLRDHPTPDQAVRVCEECVAEMVPTVTVTTFTTYRQS